VRRWLADEAIAAAQDHEHEHDHGHHHHHDRNRHDDHIRAFTLATERLIPHATLDMFLELLRAMHGPNLLRMKGIVGLAEQPENPVVIHGVQHVLHPPATLPGWPDDDHRTRLVFITRDIEPAVIENLLAAFIGDPMVDRPDAAALADNPLVPFGGRDR
jgi:G3E family GTPase